MAVEEEELGIEIVTTRRSDGAPETMEEPIYPFSFLRSFIYGFSFDSCRHEKYFPKEFILSTPKFVFQGKYSQVDQDE